MVHSIVSAGIQGIDAFLVNIEIALIKQGMPSFIMVGLAEKAVKEAQERVLTALRSCGYTLPPAKVVINLAPADKKKVGSGYDLALAIGILSSMGVLQQQDSASFLFIGELSLSGDVKGVSGILPITLCAQSHNLQAIFVPYENRHEAGIVKGIPIYPVRRLQEVIDFFQGNAPLTPYTPQEADNSTTQRYLFDFEEVKGQEHAKRAIEIAAAGGHNLLFIGPPGSGKTMLAQRIPSILPPLQFEEALEVTKIYSILNLLNTQGLQRLRPFRAPHHTISKAGLIGGGVIPLPGEISLAHCGVLFLDELLEFKRETLEVLRQPLESGLVMLSRASARFIFPAQCMLVTAMNPCPCGYRTDTYRQCTCSPHTVARYKSKLSGPLLDRIDIHVEIPSLPYNELSQGLSSHNSAHMAHIVYNASIKQQERYQGTQCKSNATLSGKLFEEYCSLQTKEQEFMKKAVHSLKLSARSYTKVLRVARTIADIEHSTYIEVPHLAEAIGYRLLDRAAW